MEKKSKQQIVRESEMRVMAESCTRNFKNTETDSLSQFGKACSLTCALAKLISITVRAVILAQRIRSYLS